ncbi:MAG: MFS transporter [Blastocatellia bacterium]|nr:MFS transporter [Blastocatellia bacterium]
MKRPKPQSAVPSPQSLKPASQPSHRIPRPVIMLGLVSLLTDVASEMLYPVAPLFLTQTLGASIVVLGTLEGFVEFVSGLLKGYFGALSDRLGSRAPFVRAGYALSALAKPLPGVWSTVAGVVTGRLADRLGKGIRSAPRDALLSGYGDHTNQGAIFGLHRAMDTTGAIIGPLLALGFLALYPGQYRQLFLWAFLPSAAAVAATWFVQELPQATGRKQKPFAPFAVFGFWRRASAPYRWLVVALTLFSIVNSSDVFLILKAGNVGFSPIAAIGGYVLYNFTYAVAAYPLGRWSDSIGKKPVLLGGWLIYAAVYAGFALATQSWHAWVLFGCYGIYTAATEGVAKAWIADLVPAADRGAAIGLQTMLASFGTLLASTTAGFLSQYVSLNAPFWYACAGSLLGILLLALTQPSSSAENSAPVT